MYSVSKSGTLSDFQKFISDVYALPDDRQYSIWDILVQLERFTMRTLKGVRKDDNKKIKYNLLISFSWLMAIANRLHIDSEENVWKRFPGLCSYCGKQPCECSTTKPSVRTNVKIDNLLKPKNLSELQKMFEAIYPNKSRTLTDASVHLAEETGELSESIHNYLGQHQQKQFEEVKLEIADYISCLLGVANSANIEVVNELSEMYKNNCHVCHKSPCECKFTEITQFIS